MDRVYHDRRMLKWLPFEALPEHNQYLKAVYDAFEVMQKPTLLPDQMAHLNYRVQEAYHLQESVTLKVYEAGRIETIQGVIMGLDPHRQSLKLGQQSIPFDAVLEVI